MRYTTGIRGVQVGGETGGDVCADGGVQLRMWNTWVCGCVWYFGTMGLRYPWYFGSLDSMVPWIFGLYRYIAVLGFYASRTVRQV